MRGAIIFLIVFVVFLMVTLGYPDLPPGRQIYDSLGVSESEEPILGIPVTTFVVAMFNAVIYGVIAWLIYTFAEKAMKRMRGAPVQEPRETKKPEAKK